LWFCDFLIRNITIKIARQILMYTQREIRITIKIARQILMYTQREIRITIKIARQILILVLCVKCVNSVLFVVRGLHVGQGHLHHVQVVKNPDLVRFCDHYIQRNSYYDKNRLANLKNGDSFQFMKLSMKYMSFLTSSNLKKRRYS
jgi:hypothetical protein